MMNLSAVSESILRSPAATITNAAEAREVITALEAELIINPGCLGLASNQIGVSKSVAIIRKRSLNITIDLINPKIVRSEVIFTNDVEGCMSFPRRRFSTPRYRAVWVETDRIWMPPNPQYSSPPKTPPRLEGDLLSKALFAYSIDQSEENHGGLICIAVQHEIDHLNGICLPYKEGSIEIPYVEEDQKKDIKVGRNDLCPCGSGRKFKKCCIDR